MLGMGLAPQHLLYRDRTGHADAFTPGDEPLGQVFGHGGESAFVGTAHVAGQRRVFR